MGIAPAWDGRRILSTMPAQPGIKGTEALPVIVFAATAMTILIFATGFPAVEATPPRGGRRETARRRLGSSMRE